MSKRFLAVAMMAGVLAPTVGCSNKTETGYEPRVLSDSMTVQRGYYAVPFSPEARMAEQERAAEGQPSHRPDYRPF
jgi:hypothetical protein